jgi:hypothetical protein
MKAREIPSLRPAGQNKHQTLSQKPNQKGWQVFLFSIPSILKKLKSGYYIYFTTTFVVKTANCYMYFGTTLQDPHLPDNCHFISSGDFSHLNPLHRPPPAPWAAQES